MFRPFGWNSFSPSVENPESINMQIPFILKVQPADVSFVRKDLFPRSLAFVCSVFHYDQLPNMHGLENLMESTVSWLKLCCPGKEERFRAGRTLLGVTNTGNHSCEAVQPLPKEFENVEVSKWEAGKVGKKKNKLLNSSLNSKYRAEQFFWTNSTRQASITNSANINVSLQT